eukprot:7342258-Pyramimonas_sp.AAC.1
MTLRPAFGMHGPGGRQRRLSRPCAASVQGPAASACVKGCPYSRIYAQPVTSQHQAARRWQQHFGALELAAPFELADVTRLA